MVWSTRVIFDMGIPSTERQAVSLDGVAAVFENAKTGARREVMGCGDHAAIGSCRLEHRWIPDLRYGQDRECRAARQPSSAITATLTAMLHLDRVLLTWLRQKRALLLM